MSVNQKNRDDLADIKFISKWLDTKFTGPFGIRFGFDSIIGIIPGVGDLISTIIGSYILLRAANLSVPKVVLFKMGLNIFIDQLLGSIPIIGDLFDFVWKSNEKNYKLVANYSQEPNQIQARAWLSICVALFIVCLVIIIPCLIIVKIFSLLFN